MNAKTKTGELLRLGDQVVMHEIACDSEDDLGEIVAIGPGDIVHVRWSVACETFTECAGDLVVSEAI